MKSECVIYSNIYTKRQFSKYILYLVSLVITLGVPSGHGQMASSI